MLTKNKVPIFGVITDTHSKEGNLKFVENIFEQFMSYLKEIDVNVAIHVGDWINERFGNDPLNTLLSIKGILKKFHERKINLFTIAGNHDKRDYTSELSYLNVIEDCSPSLQLYNFPGFYNIQEFEVRIAFLPYFKEGELYLQFLLSLIDKIKYDNKKNGKKKTILFTHTAISGVKNNDGSEVENDLESDFFDFFDLIIVGHYHNRSSLNSKIHYIGSSHAANFGEDNDKGFVIIYSDLSFDFIQTEFPKYIKVPIQLENKKDLSKKLLEYKDTEDNVRFILKGSQVELDSFDDSMIRLAGIDVKKENTVELMVNFEEIEDAEITIHNKGTVMKSWIEYADGVQMTKIERNKGLKTIKEEL